MLQCVIVRSVLQCVATAVRCSVLQRVAACCSVAVHCSALQCIVVRCSALQYVVGVLQCAEKTENRSVFCIVYCVH